MKTAFLLTWRALIRGHLVTLLFLATILAHIFLPQLVRGDGTSAGLREMFIRTLLGASYGVTACALFARACSAFAAERTAQRLSLAVVRPTSLFSVAVGTWGALTAVSFLSLLLASLFILVRTHEPPLCSHHYPPQFVPAHEVAAARYKEYKAHPELIQDEALRVRVTNEPPQRILSLLMHREMDRYDSIPPNQTGEWMYPDAFGRGVHGTNLTLRVRFATQFELLAPITGRLTLGNFEASLSNRTQAVVDVPLVWKAHATPESTTLRFHNTGKETALVRARQDLELLVSADSFALNLVRATLQMVATCALLIAFGLFLSSALSQPVALWTGFVSVLVVLISPGVVEQCPETLTMGFAERMGLVLSRGVAHLVDVMVSCDPLASLATDTAIEWHDLFQSLLVNGVVLPLVLLFAASYVVRRKPLPQSF